MIRSFSQVLEKARQLPLRDAAIVCPEEENTLVGLEEARKLGLIRPHLFGDSSRLQQLAGKLGLSLDTYQLHPCTGPEEAAREAVLFCRGASGSVLIKGFLPTPVFLRAVLNKETGIAQERPAGGYQPTLLSHVAIFQLPSWDRLLFLTDGGMVVLPNLAQKLDILRHALEVCYALELEEPKVALLASVETVSTDIPATVDAALLAMMWRRKQIKGCILDGPLALDNALFPAALAEKGIESPVAAQADVLLVPNIESGNLLGKSFSYMAGAIMAGVIQGARVPIVLVSRVDPPQSKLYSIAMSALLAARK